MIKNKIDYIGERKSRNEDKEINRIIFTLMLFLIFVLMIVNVGSVGVLADNGSNDGSLFEKIMEFFNRGITGNAVSEGEIAVTECMVLDEKGKTYRLQNDITANIGENIKGGRGNNCFDIRDNGIVLDGNGFSVDGSVNSVSSGIVARSVKEITVRNIKISGFVNGIVFDSVSDSVIEDSESNGNKERGIYLLSSDKNRILRNKLIGNGLMGLDRDRGGISVSRSSDNEIEGNEIEQNNNGVFFNIPGRRGSDRSSGNVLTNNQITGSVENNIDTFYRSTSPPNNKNSLIYENVFGKIVWTDDEFLSNMNVPGEKGLNFPGSIKIESGSVFVDSVLFFDTGIGSSVEITFNDVAGTLDEVSILKNGQECLDCEGIDLGSGELKFSVQGEGEYTLSGVFSVSEICDDGIDNDLDGFVDGDDIDCFVVEDVVCTPEEIEQGCMIEEEFVDNPDSECGNAPVREVCEPLEEIPECSYPISYEEAFGTVDVSTTGERKIANCEILDCNDNVLENYEAFEQCIVDDSNSEIQVCGDGMCLGAETFESCSLDCRNIERAICGNNLCEESLGESEESCLADCSVDFGCTLDVTQTCSDGSSIVIEECTELGLQQTGNKCPIVSECSASDYSELCSDGFTRISIDGCTGEKSGECPVLCEGDVTQTCSDGSSIVIEECTELGLQQTGNKCPIVSECKSNVLETCSDGVTVITVQECVDGELIEIGNQCPEICEGDVIQTCSNGNEITVAECNGGELQQTGNQCLIVQECENDLKKTCSDGSKIILQKCIEGVLREETGNICPAKTVISDTSLSVASGSGGGGSGGGGGSLSGDVIYSGGNPVGTIDKDGDKINIKFIQSGLAKPLSCSNGRLDSGEIEIDCGGDCGECKKERGLVLKRNLSTDILSTILIWIGLIVSMIFVLVSLYYNRSLFGKHKRIGYGEKKNIISKLGNQLR